MIRNLIWDVDGTLFDTYPAITEAFSAALTALGATAPLDRITALARQSLSHCTTTLASDFNVDPDALLLGFHEHYSAIPPQRQPPFAGAKELCERALSEGGTNVIITHRGQASLDGLLNAHEMAHYFKDSLTHDDGFPRKPDPAMFEEMMGRHDLKREETLSIGDRDIDTLAGQAAGVHTCLFGSDPGEAKADFTITAYAELYRHLGWGG